MDSARLKAMISTLEPEFAYVESWIEQIAAKVEGNVALTPPELRSQLESRLGEALSNRFVPSWLRMIDQLGGRRLHGDKLLTRITDILDSDEYDGLTRATILRALNRDIDHFLSIIRELRSSLAPLPADVLAPLQCEIGVLFPNEAVAHADNLVSELHEFDKHLRTVWELAGRADDVRLRRLDNASADFFWSAALMVGSTLASILWGIAALREKFASARKLEAEARKLDAEAADILRKRAVEGAEKDRLELHESLIASAQINDDSRRNELKGLTARAIAYFESRIDVGVIYEVRAADSPSASAELPDAMEESAAIRIREQGHVLSTFDQQLSLPLLEARNGTPGQAKVPRQAR